MSSPAVLFPFSRPVPNAWNAFGGVWRLTVRKLMAPGRWLGLCGLLGVLGLLAAISARNGSSAQFSDWIRDSYLMLLLPILAFVSAGGALSDDLKPACTDYVFTRPLNRAVYAILKYAAHLIVAQVCYLLALGVIFGVGLSFGLEGLASQLPLLLLAQALAVTAASSFGFLCAALTSRYVILGLMYASFVEVGIGRIPTQLSRLSMLTEIRTILEPLAERSGSQVGSASWLAAVGIILLFTLVTVGGSALLLQFREFSGARAKDT